MMVVVVTVTPWHAGLEARFRGKRRNRRVIRDSSIGIFRAWTANSYRAGDVQLTIYSLRYTLTHTTIKLNRELIT